MKIKMVEIWFRVWYEANVKTLIHTNATTAIKMAYMAGLEAGLLQCGRVDILNLETEDKENNDQ